MRARPSYLQPSTADNPGNPSHSTPPAARGVWRQALAWRVGVIPLPVYIVLLAAVTAATATGKLTAELLPMIATLSVFGFTCAEIGQRIPVFRSIGGPVILTTFLPAYLVFEQLLPSVFVKPIIDFWKASNILYLFIVCIIVGSILSMNRKVLIGGFLRIFAPLAAGSVAALGVGLAVGTLLGMSAFHTMFFVVIPVMAGGFGEGVVPLTLGYATLLHRPAAELLAQVFPAVMLGNLCAIMFAGCLDALGKRYPGLTGNGQLMRAGGDGLDALTQVEPDARSAPMDVPAALMAAVCLYFLGALAQSAFGLPGPVAMLSLAVAAKLGAVFPPAIERGAGALYHFFAKVVTYPLLFAVGIAITPWKKVVEACTVPTLLTIVATVATLMSVGFVVARRLNMHPIDTAIVVGTHSGMGGTGDVAILSAANRMRLMPFAQIATRIGGAITITLSLIVLARIV
ncbi:2-hydroxycarboxylate transporter family protein [Burkholderia sp. FERM BP-3421]|uniref:2-hydroxycarboxylate transporter family protein n=1 Tax=Burkholderia sp. FERM BP-3421 TaxID=1494466 RepID=UPI00235E51AF|nr:2-hydroxycarboxylate transporter family protein [Burkholderia sp. FERM BP-3421]WDD90947.1 2-hydroxycarboxylate transporter family protein [Burkholderia sp. FERM BP-3421]